MVQTPVRKTMSACVCGHDREAHRHGNYNAISYCASCHGCEQFDRFGFWSWLFRRFSR
jgi:hypothetical protein